MWKVDCYDSGLFSYTVDWPSKPSAGDVVDGARVVKVKASNDESQTIQIEVEYE